MPSAAACSTSLLHKSKIFKVESSNALRRYISSANRAIPEHALTRARGSTTRENRNETSMYKGIRDIAQSFEHVVRNTIELSAQWHRRTKRFARSKVGTTTVLASLSPRRQNDPSQQRRKPQRTADDDHNQLRSHTLRSTRTRKSKVCPTPARDGTEILTLIFVGRAGPEKGRNRASRQAGRPGKPNFKTFKSWSGQWTACTRD